MEMERINENTIRVLIGNEDLSERGITVLDLLGNHKQIESFFYSILEEVDVDHQFQENEAVTFQVLPNRNGLELFISKNSDEDADDMDAQGDDYSATDDVSDQLKQQLSGTDRGQASAAKQQSANSNDIEDYLKDAQVPTKKVMVRFADFEDFVSLAQLLRLDSVASNLYKYQAQYYLELIFFTAENTPETIKDDLAVAYEFGSRSKIAADVLSEHGQLIMENSALELARHYFAK